MVAGSSAAAVVGAVARGGVAALSSTAVVRCGEALDDAVAGQHTSVDGEVAADHKGTHGGVFLSEHVGLIGQIRLVFAAVD